MESQSPFQEGCFFFFLEIDKLTRKYMRKYKICRVANNFKTEGSWRSEADSKSYYRATVIYYLLRRKLFNSMTCFEELGRCTQKLKGVGTRNEQSHPEPKSWTSWLPCDISSCNVFKKITF